MGTTLMKIASVYFLIGIGLGYYMSIAHNYDLTGVHVHINLLGWMSLGMIGLMYHFFPSIGSNGLAKAHFWLHNIGLPIMMGGLAAMILTGNEAAFTPVVASGATVTVLGILLFVINVLKNLKAE